MQFISNFGRIYYHFEIELSFLCYKDYLVYRPNRRHQADKEKVDST